MFNGIFLSVAASLSGSFVFSDGTSYFGPFILVMLANTPLHRSTSELFGIESDIVTLNSLGGTVGGADGS